MRYGERGRRIAGIVPGVGHEGLLGGDEVGVGSGTELRGAPVKFVDLGIVWREG